jgi:hypothetical protein
MIVSDVAHAVVLDVRVMANLDAVDVASQHAAEPHARLPADPRIADHSRAVGDEHTGADLWPLSQIIHDIAHARILAMRVAKCKADLARFGR